MKRALSVLAVCCLVFAFAAYAAVGERHVEKAGGFSVQAPKGWEFREFQGSKYKVAFGPVKEGFTSNINFVDEAYKGSLKSYVDLNVQSLKKVLPQFKLIKRQDFATAGGLKGEKLVTSSFQQQMSLRQVFYFFPGPQGKNFIMVGTVPGGDNASLDPLFDESAKTFALAK